MGHQLPISNDAAGCGLEVVLPFQLAEGQSAAPPGPGGGSGLGYLVEGGGFVVDDS
ncbi:hypothetical protein A2U01_0091148, partial [Trifolium medium]|nr:hypothetical protein [Trifolium medium]